MTKTGSRFLRVTRITEAVMFVAGSVLVIVGLPPILESQKLDAEGDFEFLGNAACRITGMEHHKEFHDEEDGTYCYDRYTYTFEVGDKTETYKSAEEWKLRSCIGTSLSGPDDCPKCRANQSSFDTSQRVGCWMSAREDSRQWYNCGNDPCYKVLDPQLDIAEAQGGAFSNPTYLLGVLLVFPTVLFAPGRLLSYLRGRGRGRGSASAPGAEDDAAVVTGAENNAGAETTDDAAVVIGAENNAGAENHAV